MPLKQNTTGAQEGSLWKLQKLYNDFSGAA